MAKNTTTQKSAVSPHECPETKPGHYQWPCPICCAHYYQVQNGIMWHYLVITGGVGITQSKAFDTEYDCDQGARKAFRKLNPDTDSIFWAKLKHGQLITGEFPAGFFEKKGEEDAD